MSCFDPELFFFLRLVVIMYPRLILDSIVFLASIFQMLGIYVCVTMPSNAGHLFL